MARLIVVITDFTKTRVHQQTIPIEYSSKERFLTDLKKEYDKGHDYISFFKSNGNDGNWRRDQFEHHHQYFPPIVYTVEEFFEGRDPSEINKYISIECRKQWW